VKYKLEIEMFVDPKNEARAIKVARESYSPNGGARYVGEAKAASPKAFIGDIQSALMELLEQNPLLKRAGLHLVGMSCSNPLELSTQPDKSLRFNSFDRVNQRRGS
jgi:hypothetical protein